LLEQKGQTFFGHAQGACPRKLHYRRKEAEEQGEMGKKATTKKSLI